MRASFIFLLFYFARISILQATDCSFQNVLPEDYVADLSTFNIEIDECCQLCTGRRNEGRPVIGTLYDVPLKACICFSGYSALSNHADYRSFLYAWNENYTCNLVTGIGAGRRVNAKNGPITIQDCLDSCFEEKRTDPAITVVSLRLNTPDNGNVRTCYCERDALGIVGNTGFKACDMERPSESACGSAIDGKLISGGTVIPKGHLSFWRCCKACREELAHAMRFHQLKSFEYHQSCFCYTGAYISFDRANFTIMEYYHKKFHPTTLQAGESNNITVVNPFKTTKANDKVTVFVLDEMTTPAKRSNSISLHGISDTALKIEFNRDKILKRNTSFEHDLVAQGSYLENYKFEIEIFGQDGFGPPRDIWLVMKRSNDEFHEFFAENFNVTKSQSKEFQCLEGEFVVLSKKSLNGKGNVQVSYTADKKCNTDISDFRFTIYAEESVEITNVTEGENCIPISNVLTLNRKTVVTYDYYLFDQSLCFNIEFGIKDDAKILHGTKSSTVVVDATISVLNITKSRIIRSKTVDVVIASEKAASKGFSIFTTSFDRCLKAYDGHNGELQFTNYQKPDIIFEICDSFAPIHKHWKSEYNGCLKIDSIKSSIGNCNSKEEMLEERDGYMYSNNLEVKKKSGTLLQGSKKLLTFQRRGNFGVHRVKKRYKGQPDIITSVSDNVTYFACVAYLNRSTAKCVEFNPTKSSIKVLPVQFHQLLGYEASRKVLYGLDKKGRFITFDQVRTKFISEARWTKIKSSKQNSLVTAVYKQRTELILEPVNVYGNFNVTYFGLFDQLSPTILWPPDSGCVDTVGTTRETAMKSCNAIINYCPQAKSKVYILAKSYADSNYGKIYCDMDTYEGGWMAMVDYTAENEVVAASSFLSKHVSNNPFDVVESNFTKMITTSTGFSNIETNFGAIQQLRFYCKTNDFGKTIHIITLPNTLGLGYISYVKMQATYAPNSCLGYTVILDDTSGLFANCKELGGTPSSNNYPGENFNGEQYLESRVILEPFFMRRDYIYDLPSFACDTNKLSDGTLLRYGNWKVYALNAL